MLDHNADAFREIQQHRSQISTAISTEGNEFGICQKGVDIMLRFAEEIMLLLLGDDDGKFAHLPTRQLNYCLAGSVLMDLALEGRIDTDPNTLTPIDTAPTGDSILDPCLDEIREAPHQQDARFWLDRIAERGEEIRSEVLRRLLAMHIVDKRGDDIKWVFTFNWRTRRWSRARRYPFIDGKPMREVKTRIMDIIFNDEIPDPRDVMIVGLAESCGIFEALLDPTQHRQAAPRIEQVRTFDLLTRAVHEAVQEHRPRLLPKPKPQPAKRQLAHVA